MANFFPAGSRTDVERASSSSRRTQSRGVLRESGDDSSSDSRQSRPSHINWLPSPSATTQQAGPSMPRRPPSVQLARSASLSALAGASPTLRRQSSLTSNHSLQPDRPAASATLVHPTVKQLSPISERSYVSSPKREQCFTDVEQPSTPISIGSSYSAFLRRPLKRSISATSTSSLRTDATSPNPPTLPPLNLSPLELRPVYPPVSHRAGQQLVSTVYEDAGSERTGSFVTARSASVVGEDDTAASPNVHGLSHSTILSSPTAARSGSRSDPLADLDRTTEGTTTLLGGGVGGGYSADASSSSNSNGSGVLASSSNISGDAVPPARPRPRKRTPTSGGGASPSDTFIWRRWTRDLSFGSRLSRPSFSAARRAVLSRLPPLPILLFWAGFLAPWCWLIGGWLIEEARWEDSGKARAALPLWRPRSAKRRRGAGKAVVGLQVPPDSLGKDLEKGDAAVVAAAAAAREAQVGAGEEGEGEGAAVGGEAEAGAAGKSRLWHWAAPGRWMVPFACWRQAAALGQSPGNGEKVVTFVKPYSAEVWVYRCRLAAVVSALILLTALIIAIVVIGGSTS